MASESASSSLDGRRPLLEVNCVAGAGDVALPAAQRARRPVLPAQLVEHGAVDAGPGELLERRALGRVVAVDRGDQRLEAAGDEVLHLAAGGSSRTFLKTMYFTSGANVMTSRLRTRTSPVVLYSCHRACASSGEMRFFVCWRERTCHTHRLLRRGGRIPDSVVIGTVGPNVPVQGKRAAAPAL